MKSDAAGFTRSEIILLALLSLTYFATNSDSQAIAPLLPKIREALGVAENQVVWLVAVYGAAAAINAILMGIVVDRYGAARILPLGYVIFCTGQLVNALSPSLSMLLAGRMITGIGSSTLSLSMMVLISEVFSEGRRSGAFGYFVGAGAAAAVIGLPAAGWLAEKLHWHAPFAVIFCLAATTGIAIHLTSRSELRRSAPAKDAFLPSAIFFQDVLGRRRLMLVLSLGMLFNIGIYAMVTPLGLWGKAKFGLTTQQIFSFYVVGGLGGILMAPIAGKLANRFGIFRLLHVSTLGLMILIPLFPILPDPRFFYVLFFLAVAFDLLRLVPFQVLSVEAVDPNCRARFLGLRNTISQFGIFTGAAIGGQLYARLEAGYLASCIFAAFSCLITFPIIYLISSGRYETAQSNSARKAESN